MKTILMKIIGFPFNIIPLRIISKLISLQIRVLTIARSSKNSLYLLLDLEMRLYSLTGHESCRYGGGEHTKIKHIKYHKFFCNNIVPDEEVFDVGFGKGSLPYKMALKGAIVTGIELSKENYLLAKKKYSHPNISFIHGNVLKDLPNKSVNTITLSNVLEHIKDRINLIKTIQEKLNPRKWLIRVPMYERDWRVPLMDELGVDYRLDKTHFIEFTLDEFINEIKLSGLYIDKIDCRWGEILCIAKPIN